MRQISFFKVCPLLFSIAAMFFAGCNEMQEEVKAEFSLGQTSLEVPAEGGEFAVAYFLSNPVEGQTVVPKCEETWIHDFDMSTEGKVCFVVDPTDIELYDREAVMTLVYGDEERQLIIVQKGGEASVEFVVEQARHYSFVVKIVPKDPEMRFFVTGVRKETMDSYESDEEVFAADAEHFKRHAELSDMTMEEYFWQMYNLNWYYAPPRSYTLLRSVYNMTDEWFQPGTDYCVYCYGVDEEGKPLTQVYRQYVNTLPLNLDSQLQLDVTADVKGQNVTVAVEPSDVSSMYYYGATLTNDKPDDEFRREIQDLIDRTVFMTYSYPGTVEAGGVDWKELVSSVAGIGPEERTLDFGVADRTGKAFAYAIDDMGNIISEGTVVDFTTGDISLSDNKITLTISDVDFRSACINVSTTNNDPYQICYAVDDGGYEGLSSEELIDRIWHNGKTAANGSGNARYLLQDLAMETEYVVVGYGFDKGKVTTDAVMTTFATTARDVAEVTCTPYVYKYFSSLEAAEKYPEQYGDYADYDESAVIQVKVDVTGEPSWYLYHILPTATVNNMSDEQLLNTVDNLYKNVGPCGPEKIFTMALDRPMTLFGVAVDKDGNYGPIYKKEYTFTKEGMSSIDEFVIE